MSNAKGISKSNIGRLTRAIGIRPSKVSAGNSPGNRESLSDVAKRVGKAKASKRVVL